MAVIDSGGSSSNRKTTSPNWSCTPLLSKLVSTLRPFTKVPFRLPRSVTKAPSGPISIRACSRERLASGMQRSDLLARPTVVVPAWILYRAPAAAEAGSPVDSRMRCGMVPSESSRPGDQDAIAVGPVF